MRCTLGNGVYSAGFLSFGFVCCGEGGGDGRRLADVAPVHVLRVFRRPGAGMRRPACRCCGLRPRLRRTWAGTFRASRSEPGSEGWLYCPPDADVPPAGTGRPGVQRPASSLYRRICPSLPVRPGAWGHRHPTYLSGRWPRGPRSRVYPTAESAPIRSLLL